MQCLHTHTCVCTCLCITFICKTIFYFLKEKQLCPLAAEKLTTMFLYNCKCFLDRKVEIDEARSVLLRSIQCYTKVSLPLPHPQIFIKDKVTKDSKHVFSTSAPPTKYH